MIYSVQLNYNLLNFYMSARTNNAKRSNREMHFMNFRPNPLLYGAYEDFLSSFKLVVTMCDEVDHKLLLKAVHSAMKRYPYFSVSPQKNR